MNRLCLLLSVLIVSAATVMESSAAYAETAQEAANRQVVIGYFAALDRLEKLTREEAQKGLPAVLSKYCRPDYIQHSESMAAYGQGTAGLMRLMNSTGTDASTGPALGAAHVITTMARGDLVVRINTREMPGGAKPLLIFNLFRIQNGLIAEHWDGYSGPNPLAPK